MHIKPEEITSIIKNEIKNYEKELETVDSGTIIQIGDGVARVYGLEECMEGELLEFPNQVFGMALNLEQDNVGCVLLGSEEGIKEGAMQSFITILKLNLENGFRTILISKFKNIRIAWHQLITRYFF